jgi:7,8-dihydropterin-6-yl-methyl-4-(beta-D-ribofuranosyl)aminobenzene 5'-phosphate synthase
MLFRVSEYAGLLIPIAMMLRPAAGGAAPHPNRITILYDAFGKPSALKKDWGYSALIEYGGKKILFDTGNDAESFQHNVATLGVNLKDLDFVVLSHRHGDHTSGLSYVLSVNPNVTIYAPYEVSGFGYRRHEGDA